VGDLGGLDDLSWVVTAYLLGATVSMPLWGRLSDLFGRKRLFEAAIVVFLAGSALSGVAQSLGELIGFRALQGLGAGGLMTLAMAIVADIVSPRERGRYQGYIQMVFVLASVAGPLLGGLFVDHLSWRWVFYVNLPIGAVALAVISSALHLPAARGRPSIDYLGAALLGGGLTSALLVTVWGGRQYAWGSAQILAMGAAAAVLLAAFVAQERRAFEPILPLRLFREPVFDVVAVVLFLTTLAFFAAIVFVPLFLQVATGASATVSGLLLLPLLLGAAASTAVSGRLISTTGRYKRFPVAGLALMALGLFLLSLMDAATPAPPSACSWRSSASGSGWSRRCWSWRSRTPSSAATSHRDRLVEPLPVPRRIGRRRRLRGDLREPARPLAAPRAPGRRLRDRRREPPGEPGGPGVDARRGPGRRRRRRRPRPPHGVPGRGAGRGGGAGGGALPEGDAPAGTRRPRPARPSARPRPSRDRASAGPIVTRRPTR